MRRARRGARGRRSVRTPPPVSSGRRTDFHTHVCGGWRPCYFEFPFRGPNLVQNQTRGKHKVDAVRKIEAAAAATTKGGSELLPLFQFESSSQHRVLAKHVTITLEQREKKNICKPIFTKFLLYFQTVFALSVVSLFFLALNPLRAARACCHKSRLAPRCWRRQMRPG